MAEATGFSFTKLFEDPNFIQMLGSVGAELAPDTFAGPLGRAAVAYSRNKAAQTAAGKQMESSRTEREELRKQHQQLIDRLGGFTAPGTTGINSAKPTKTGGLLLDLDTEDEAATVNMLGGITPKGTPGINNIRRSDTGSMLIDLDPPDFFADEVSALAAAPTANRSQSRLSFTPTPPAQKQAEIDSLIEPYAPRGFL